jgi:hypothetical protein
MSCCNLDYIPDRLKLKDDSAIYETFALDDIIYRRVNDDTIDNPYATISLTDLSHNIGTNFGNEVSKSKDVLFSILEDDGIDIYQDFKPLKLKIISLSESDNYDKFFVCDKSPELRVRVKLQHDPVCCMHPHCVFQFFTYNENEAEIEVSFTNYKETIGAKKYKYLRDKIRQEFALMIVREEISYEDRE